VERVGVRGKYFKINRLLKMSFSAMSILSH
jgi:hypothetical protein